MMNIKLKNLYIVCILMLGCFISATSQEVILIAHKDIGFDTIKSKDVKYIFLGKIRKLKGVKINPVTIKSGDVHDRFLDLYIKRNSRQYSKFWKKILFTGKGKPPKSFKTEAELIKYVASTPGAIGYISKLDKAEGVIQLKAKD
ncbi:MAG: hypothetical protein COA79_19915 [Planctomycetota bacterium]|nr:MAG: hypothetical protein COA79_19915 [Planctomycetota bacterium]